MKQTLFGAAAFALGATFALTSCQSDDIVHEEEAGGRHVRMSVSLGINSDETRTTLTEIDGSLKCTWDEGDKVWVMDLEGNKLGELSLVSGYEGQQYAKFDGDLIINDPNMEQVTFVYFGTNVNPTEIETANGTRWTFDYTSQKGTFASLSEQDFLWSTTDIEITGGIAYTEEMGLERYISFGHFELVFPEGVTRTNEPVTVSGDNVKGQFSLRKNASGTVVSGDKTITVGGSGNDLYMTIIPVGGVTPTFSVTIGGKTYTGSLASRTWTASEFVRKSHGVGVPVVMETESGAVDHSKNPLNKWAEGNLSRSGSGASATGTISSYTATGSYYQFGRNHGFNSVSDAQTNYGVERSDMASNRNVYPGTGSTATVPTYYATTVDFTKYTNYFFIDNNHDGDYTTPSRGDTWSERAKKMGYTNSTPCPAGWRLPTVAEYKEILPVIDGKAGSTGSGAWDTLVQIKTLVDGSKCAFRWSHTSISSYTYLKIEALMVDDKATTTSVDWSDSNVVTRYFKGSGYINAHRNLWQLNSGGYVTTHYTARPMAWGLYSGSAQNNGTVVVSMTKNYMTWGGFYWTSDAVQGVFSMIFNDASGYTFGYYLTQYDNPMGANIRCVKAE